ncbi:hypothetical protein MKW92_025129 [Papaver armeniacum]|nr:hypothetical protein MKW92_025129 [Papaver armeniacum]
MTDLLVLDPWHIFGNAFPLAECYPGMKIERDALKYIKVWVQFLNLQNFHHNEAVMGQIAYHLGMVLALRPTNANPVGDELMLAQIHLNIERPLRFALRVKVGSNPESMIYLYYLNIPYRICNNCFRLGHLVDSCALLNNRELEGIYDVNEFTEPDVTESQSWEPEFKVLFGDQIDNQLVSDARMASSVNISPISVLNREDISIEDISSGNTRTVGLEEGGEVFVPESEEIITNRKRLFSEISPDLCDFPPETGFLQVVVNQRLSSYETRPDFNFETADAHFSFSKELSEDEEDEFYTPYREMEVESSQAAFRLSINSPDTIDLNSSLDSNSVDMAHEVQSKFSIDQFGSFLGSDRVDKLEQDLNQKVNKDSEDGGNQINNKVAAEEHGDAGNKQKGIQVLFKIKTN